MARPVACTCQSDIGVHWDLLRQTAWKAHAFCKDTDTDGDESWWIKVFLSLPPLRPVGPDGYIQGLWWEQWRLMKKTWRKSAQKSWTKISNVEYFEELKKGKHHNPKQKIQKASADSKKHYKPNNEFSKVLGRLFCFLFVCFCFCYVVNIFLASRGGGEGHGWWNEEKNEFRTETCKMGGLNARFFFCRCYFFIFCGKSKPFDLLFTLNSFCFWLFRRNTDFWFLFYS